MIGGMAKTKHPASERVFSGVYSTGISYADKDVEVHGDYKKLAFLPFSTLVLEWYANRVPPDVREYIEWDAAKMQARRGQQYAVSSSGQTVTLGSGGGGGDSGGGGSGGKSKPRHLDAARMQAAIDAARPVDRTPAQLNREIDAVVRETSRVAYRGGATRGVDAAGTVDAGSHETMPMHHWMSSVMDGARLSEVDLDRYVTRERMHLWFHHGETVSGAVDMVRRLVINGRREERADAEVDAMRGLVRAAIRPRR